MMRAPAAQIAGRPAKFAERKSAQMRRDLRRQRAQSPDATCLFDLSATRDVRTRVRGV